MSDDLIVGIIAAVSGLLVAALTVYWNTRNQREMAKEQAKFQELMLNENARLQKSLIALTDSLNEKSQHYQRVFDSLEWFESGTRRRTIGLSVVSANWESMSEMHDIWKNILINQAVYLISEAKRKREEHEASNLQTIKNLLEKAKLDKDDRSIISNALTSRMTNGKKGMEMTQKELGGWNDFVSS